MSGGRGSIFAAAGAAAQPEVSHAKKIDTAAAIATAAKIGFGNRIDPGATSEPATPSRVDRRKRTGRALQLNIKVTQEEQDRFFKLVDATGMVQGALLERALIALEREIAGTQPS